MFGMQLGPKCSRGLEVRFLGQISNVTGRRSFINDMLCYDACDVGIRTGNPRRPTRMIHQTLFMKRSDHDKGLLVLFDGVITVADACT